MRACLPIIHEALGSVSNTLKKKKHNTSDIAPPNTATTPNKAKQRKNNKPKQFSEILSQNKTQKKAGAIAHW